MSNKASLTNTELEVTQKMQTHFPRGLDTKVLGAVNSCPVENLTAALMEMVDKLASGAKAKVSKLLELVTSVKVAAVKEFIAADKFKAGETVDGVKYYSSFGGNFIKHFLSKVERDVAATDLRVHKLLCNSKDLGIRTGIGEDNEETSLAHLQQCLKRQGNGEKGDLLINGWANIFYIRDMDGNLWAVRAYWCGVGWCLSADSVEDPDGWSAGDQVFSR